MISKDLLPIASALHNHLRQKPWEPWATALCVTDYHNGDPAIVRLLVAWGIYVTEFNLN